MAAALKDINLPDNAFPREWERVHDAYTAPNGARATQELMRLKVPGGWLVTRPGVYTLCYVPDPDHQWALAPQSAA